jgi:hypothetical protein
MTPAATDMNDTTTDITGERPPYLLAGAVALATLVLYVLTLAPTAQFWDTPEYIAAAYSLGIPHPPGNPLFVILAHVWGMIPWMATYAARINLMSAVLSALSAGFWFLIGERWLRPVVPARWPRRAAALAGSVMAATVFTVWNQSVVNEKVYTVSLLSIALVLWLVVRWGDQAAGSRRDHKLLVIVYLLALTATNHLMGLLVGPAIVVYVLYTDPKVFLSPKFLAWAAVAVVLGVSLWAFLIVRSPHFPPINEGEPTTWAALRDVVNRGQYGKPPLSERQAPLGTQLAMWGDYFAWQWGRDWAAGVRRALALGFGALGLLGAWRHLKADRRSGWAMAALMVTVIPLLVYYLNFKYRFGTHPSANLLDEVRERDYFFVVSFALWGLWAAMGLATVMEWVQSALSARIADAGHRWALATPVLAVALVPLVGNRLAAPRSGERLARDFAYDMLQSCEPYSILVTAGDNDTFPLWYAQVVEHVRDDVSVLNLSLANTDWYDRQLERRPLATFDSAAAPALWRHRSYPKPAGPIWSLSIPALDSIAPYYPLRARQTLNISGFPVTLDPERLHPPYPYLERADVMVLRAIQDQFGTRPIAFARTTADYADRFGLTPYLVGQGMVRVLEAPTAVLGDTIQPSPVLGLVDVPRSRELLEHVYHAHTAARHRAVGWVDVPSENILATYAYLYQGTGLFLVKTDPAAALTMLALADSMIANTSLGRRGPR